MKHAFLFLILTLLLASASWATDGLGGVDLLGPQGYNMGAQPDRSGPIDSSGLIHYAYPSSSTQIVYCGIDLKQAAYNRIGGGTYTCPAKGPQYLQMVPDEAGGAYLVWAELTAAPRSICINHACSLNGFLWPAPAKISSDTLPPTTMCLVSASDMAGGVLVGWVDPVNTIRVQRIASTGDQLWGPNGAIALNMVGVVGTTLSLTDIQPDGTGGALLLAKSSISGYPSRTSWYAIRMGANGTPLWVKLLAQSSMTNSADLASDGHGGCLVVWNDNTTVKAQRLDEAGTPQWPSNGVTLASYASVYTLSSPIAGDLQVVPSGNGEGICTWVASGGNSMLLYTQKLNAAGESQWASNGLSLGVGGCGCISVLSPDSSGGAYVGVTRESPVGSPSSIQHISSEGKRLWGPKGIPLGIRQIQGMGAYSRGGLYAVTRNSNGIGFAHHFDDYWSFKAEAPVRSAVTIVDGVAYFGCDDGRIYAVSATRTPDQPYRQGEIGTLQWRYPESMTTTIPPLAPIRSRPVYYNGALYYTDSYGYVSCLVPNSTTASLRFRIRPDTRAVISSGATSTPAVGPEGIFVGINTRDGGKLYKLDSMGKPVGFLPAGRAITSSPALYNDRVIFACEGDCEGALKVARTSDLTILSVHEGNDREVIASPSIDPLRNRAYVTDWQGGLMAMDLARNVAIPDWPLEPYRHLPGAVETSAWLDIYRDYNKAIVSTLYLPTTNGYICALNPDDGSPLPGYPFKPAEWSSFHASAMVLPVPSITSQALNRQIYLGSQEGGIFVFDPTNPGDYLYSRVPGSLMASPGAYLYANITYATEKSDVGSLVYPSTDGSVYGFAIR